MLASSPLSVSSTNPTNATTFSLVAESLAYSAEVLYRTPAIFVIHSGAQSFHLPPKYL
jgi:hypothetical protein